MFQFYLVKGSYRLLHSPRRNRGDADDQWNMIPRAPESDQFNYSSGWTITMFTFKHFFSAAVVVAGALAVTPVLSSQAALSDCPSARVCVFQSAGFSGALLGYRQAGVPLQDVSLPNNDRMSSWGNKTTTNARWYQHAGGGGFCLTMAAGGTNSYVGDGYNDQMSSWATNRGC